MAETTAPLAGQHATRDDVLDLRSLQVLGIIQAHDGTTALLRSSRGQVARVHVGDAAFGMQVTAIGTDRVMLTNRWGQTEALLLPQG